MKSIRGACSARVEEEWRGQGRGKERKTERSDGLGKGIEMNRLFVV